MTDRVLATVLATWSAAFAVVHAAWALGWRGGVPAGTPDIADRPVFLTYDVVAGLLMVAAAVVVGLLVRRPTRLLLRLTAVGSVLALLRGVPALAIDLAGGDLSGVGVLADTWFSLSGVLGLVLWARLRTRCAAGGPA
jgi:hypothetical protein